MIMHYFNRLPFAHLNKIVSHDFHLFEKGKYVLLFFRHSADHRGRFDCAVRGQFSHQPVPLHPAQTEAAAKHDLLLPDPAHAR